MKKISFEGKEYVKATEVAKKFRYTQDYVGQLCRSDKVDSRMVGRSWYVTLDSVAAYRKTKHKTQKEAAKKTALSKPKRATRNPKKPTKKVEPVTRTKTIRLATKQKNNEMPVVRYTKDDSVLVPVLNNSLKPRKKTKTKVTVDTQPAIAVKVQSQKKKDTKFVSEKLPEISLSGKLSVSDHSGEPIENHEEEASVLPVDSTLKDESNILQVQETGADAADEMVDGGELSNAADSTKKEQRVSDVEIAAVDTKKVRPTGFTPASIATNETDSEKRFPYILVFSLITAGLLSLMIIGIGSVVSVEEGEYKKGVTFTLSSLFES